MPFSLTDIMPVLRRFPDADDKVIAAFVKAKKALGDAWDMGNKPLFNLPDESVQNPVGKFALQLGEGMTSPISLGLMLASGGATAAGRAGLTGLYRGVRAAEAGVNAATAGEGLYRAAHADTGADAAGGALQALLAGVSHYTANPGQFKATLRNLNGPVSEFTELAPGRFRGALRENPAKASLSDTVPQRFFKQKGHERYYGLNDLDAHPITGQRERDLVAVMNNERGGGGLRPIMDDANMRGATTLDAWDVKSEQVPEGMLPYLYKKYGYEPIGHQPFDPAYGMPSPDLLKAFKKQGWKGGDFPGVTYMKRTGPAPVPQPTRLARLLTDETGALNLSGFSPAAKRVIDEIEAMRKAAGPHGKMFPTVENVAKTIKSGDIGTVLDTAPRVKLAETIPGVRLNERKPLNQVVQIGPRKGAVLSPWSQQRLDAISQFGDAHLNPATFDWTDPQWMSLFESPAEATRFARIFGAVSPRVELRKNFGDALSVRWQDRMGVPVERMLDPFGYKKTGFNIGLPKTKLPNLKKALYSPDAPIGSALPAKTNELTEGMLGNPDAYPWDIHIGRAKGVDTDAPGTPIQYLLTKLAYKDYAQQRGAKTFPNMAKNWSIIKSATGIPDTGFVDIANRVAKAEPTFLREFTPRNENDLFEALMRVNDIFGVKSATAGKFMKKYRNPTLF